MKVEGIEEWLVRRKDWCASDVAGRVHTMWTGNVNCYGYTMFTDRRNGRSNKKKNRSVAHICVDGPCKSTLHPPRGGLRNQEVEKERNCDCARTVRRNIEASEQEVIVIQLTALNIGRPRAVLRTRHGTSASEWRSIISHVEATHLPLSSTFLEVEGRRPNKRKKRFLHCLPCLR